MVTTTHNCKVCHKQFPEDQREEAEEHEAIPIREGDFDNVVLKCGKDCGSHYLVYRKKVPERVNESHERIYTERLLCWKYEVNLPPGREELSMDKWGDYSVSELEERIRGKHRLPLTPEEMNILKTFIGRAHNGPYYLDVEKLRTR